MSRVCSPVSLSTFPALLNLLEKLLRGLVSSEAGNLPKKTPISFTSHL